MTTNNSAKNKALNQIDADNFNIEVDANFLMPMTGKSCNNTLQEQNFKEMIMSATNENTCDYRAFSEYKNTLPKQEEPVVTVAARRSNTLPAPAPEHVVGQGSDADRSPSTPRLKAEKSLFETTLDGYPIPESLKNLVQNQEEAAPETRLFRDSFLPANPPNEADHSANLVSSADSANQSPESIATMISEGLKGAMVAPEENPNQPINISDDFEKTDLGEDTKESFSEEKSEDEIEGESDQDNQFIDFNIIKEITPVGGFKLTRKKAIPETIVIGDATSIHYPRNVERDFVNTLREPVFVRQETIKAMEEAEKARIDAFIKGEQFIKTNPEMPALKIPALNKPKKSFWGKFKNVVGAAAVGFLALFAAKDSSVESNAGYQEDPVRVAETKPMLDQTPAPAFVPEIKRAEIKVDENKTELERAKLARSIEVLNKSEDPVLSSVLKNGEFKMQANLRIMDAMITPYLNVANAEQKEQIRQLRIDLQRGLMIYFYEKFGTPAAVQESLKDAKLSNLYKTAQKMKLANLKPILSAEAFERARNLGNQMMEDSDKLEQNRSQRINSAMVNGNLFQAKIAGESVKMEDKNGKKHILLERMDQIFDGAISAIRAQNKLADASDQQVNTFKKASKFAANSQTGTTKLYSAKQSVLAQKQADELNEVDAGWDRLLDETNKKSPARLMLENQRSVQFKINYVGQTGTQQKDQIIPNLAKELTVLMPEANPQVIEHVVRQYGFVALESYKQDGENVEIKLRPRFVKILKFEIAKGDRK